jgi:hypothetical protein
LTLAVVQQQDFAALVGQGGDQFGGDGLLLLFDQAFDRRRLRVGGGFDGRIGMVDGPRPATAAAQMIVGEVTGDLPQPRQEAGRVLRFCQALRKASWAMSSLAGTSRVIARATAVTVFWLAATIRP